MALYNTYKFQYLSRHHSVPAMSMTPSTTSGSNITDQPPSTPNPRTSTSPTVSSSPESICLASSPGPESVACTPVLRIEVDDAPSARLQNAPVDVYAAGRLSPVSPGI